MTKPLLSCLTGTTVFTVLVLLWRLCIRRDKLPLPPGPPGHWLFGNSFPRTYPHRTFADWTKKYGPVFSLKVGNTIFISVNSHQAAMDIMEKEGAALIDRPRDIAAGEIHSGGMRTILTRQGDRLKRIRRAIKSQLTPRILNDYKPVQYCYAKQLIKDIINDPIRHIEHARSYAASTIVTMTYGKQSPSHYFDPAVQAIVRINTQLTSIMKPGALAVNQYPILVYVPGYLKTLKRWHQEELSLLKEQLAVVRQQMVNNEANPCFGKYILEQQTHYHLSDDEAAYLTGTLFGAGSDTTAAAINVAIMAIACFSVAQERAQKQLDEVVGRDRLPNFDDIQELTEVVAFVLESYRWRPVAVGGFAHRATKDIIYNGYLIPEGAAVQGNHWAIGRDESVYPDPEEFKPERWLDKEGKIDLRNEFPNFGFGRRVCPGQQLANHSLYMNVALLLWSFSIKEDPNEPIDTFAFTDGAHARPLPFKAVFEIRHDKVRPLIDLATT